MKRFTALVLALLLALSALPALAWTQVCAPEADLPITKGELSAEEVLRIAAEQLMQEGLYPQVWQVAAMVHAKSTWFENDDPEWYVLLTGKKTDRGTECWELKLDAQTGTINYSSGRTLETSPERLMTFYHYVVALRHAEDENGPSALWPLADRKTFYDQWPVAGLNLDVLREGDVTEEQAVMIARGALRQEGLDMQELEGRIPIIWCMVEPDGSRQLSIQFATTDMMDVNYGVVLALPDGWVLSVDAEHGNG